MRDGQGDPRLKSRARKALRASKAKERRPCWRCGQPIDYTLPAPMPGSYVLGEIIDRADGGDPLDPENTAAEHWVCNARAAAERTNRGRRTRRTSTLAPLETTREW